MKNILFFLELIVIHVKNNFYLQYLAYRSERCTQVHILVGTVFIHRFRTYYVLKCLHRELKRGIRFIKVWIQIQILRFASRNLFFHYIHCYKSITKTDFNYSLFKFFRISLAHILCRKYLCYLSLPFFYILNIHFSSNEFSVPTNSVNITTNYWFVFICFSFVLKFMQGHTLWNKEYRFNTSYSV